MASKSIMSISDRATYLVAQNDRYASIAELADEPTRAALAMVGKAVIESALSDRDAYLLSGHAIHDLVNAFDPEKWAKHDPVFKNAGELVAWVFPAISPSDASARSKTWEMWGDYSKLDATKKAIWDAGTSANALYRLTQVPSAMLEQESAKGHNYFTLQEGKDLAKAAKEPKQKVITPKNWVEVVVAERYANAGPNDPDCDSSNITDEEYIAVQPWKFAHAPDRPKDGAITAKLPNGDVMYIYPARNIDDEPVYTSVQLREVKPEPKRIKSARPLDPAAAVKNMTDEQKQAILSEILATMGKTLAE